MTAGAAAFGQLSDSLLAVIGNGAGASLLADAARRALRTIRGRRAGRPRRHWPRAALAPAASVRGNRLPPPQA